MTTPQPGDYACVSMGGEGGRLVALGEKLAGDAFTQYQHAFIYLGSGQIMQAEPNGAVQAPLGGYGHILWSTGRIPLTPGERGRIVAAAARYDGTPYSWLDYAAIALHSLHLPAPGLKRYIQSTRHMICSQLVDQCYQDAGVHLFRDGRWPGYVTPADLAARLEIVQGYAVADRP
jgi:cell wall-associated NlpC family hydrolase